jgi:hypothetical protein
MNRGSLTIPAPEAGNLVEWILVYTNKQSCIVQYSEQANLYCAYKFDTWSSDAVVILYGSLARLMHVYMSFVFLNVTSCRFAANIVYGIIQ